LNFSLQTAHASYANAQALNAGGSSSTTRKTIAEAGVTCAAAATEKRRGVFGQERWWVEESQTAAREIGAAMRPYSISFSL
jgi:hypothetical protein